MDTHDEERPVSSRGLAGAVPGLHPLNLLTYGFRQEEIERLTRWQMRYRTRPDALDLPIDMFRLRFARWLVEHGRLSEDIAHIAAEGDGMPASASPWETSPVPIKYLPLSYFDPQFRLECGHRNHRDERESRPRRALGRLAKTVVGAFQRQKDVQMVRPGRQLNAGGVWWDTPGSSGPMGELWKLWAGLRSGGM